MKKNKRGFLLASETLKIIIAVICIVFLVYFLVSLYYNNVNGKDKKTAETDLSRMKDIILALEEGEVQGHGLIEPSGWYLLGFTFDVKPNFCAGKNCMCICKNVFEYGFKEEIVRQAEKCNEKGSCIIVENLKEFSEIEIKGPDELVQINIKKSQRGIEIES